MSTFGENLKTARIRQNLSQRELAKRVGTTNTVVSAWEKDTYYPEFEKFLKLCDCLETTPNDLICPEHEFDVLSKTEEAIINAVRGTLPIGQQHVLEDALYQQQRYPIDQKEKKKSSPVFLTKGDDDYEEMTQRLQELIDLKNKTKFSLEQLTRFLWIAGYDGKLSQFNVQQVFRGTKIPSKRLFNYMKACMEYKYIITIIEEDVTD